MPIDSDIRLWCHSLTVCTSLFFLHFTDLNQLSQCQIYFCLLLRRDNNNCRKKKHQCSLLSLLKSKGHSVKFKGQVWILLN